MPPEELVTEEVHTVTTTVPDAVVAPVETPAEVMAPAAEVLVAGEQLGKMEAEIESCKMNQQTYETTHATTHLELDNRITTLTEDLKNCESGLAALLGALVMEEKMETETTQTPSTEETPSDGSAQSVENNAPEAKPNGKESPPGKPRGLLKKLFLGA